MEPASEWCVLVSNMKRRRFFALLPVALLLTGCNMDDFSLSGSMDRFKEDFHLNYPMKPGGSLSLETLNGSVEIVSWEKDEVDVNGMKYCFSEDRLRQFVVEGKQDGNKLTLRASQAEGRRSGCGAKFTLRVPKKILLEGISTSNGGIRVDNLVGDAVLKSSNGSIRVKGLEGRLDAKTSNALIDINDVLGDFVGRTSNGSIAVDGLEGSFSGTTSNASIKGKITKLKAGQALKADTSNGSIDLSLPDYKGQAVELETSNASVTLGLPENANADLRASTSNSSINCDFELREGAVRSKARLEGKIGQGGGLVRIGTSNGSVRIRKL